MSANYVMSGWKWFRGEPGINREKDIDLSYVTYCTVIQHDVVVSQPSKFDVTDPNCNGIAIRILSRRRLSVRSVDVLFFTVRT